MNQPERPRPHLDRTQDVTMQVRTYADLLRRPDRAHQNPSQARGQQEPRQVRGQQDPRHDPSQACQRSSSPDTGRFAVGDEASNKHSMRRNRRQEFEAVMTGTSTAQLPRQSASVPVGG